MVSHWYSRTFVSVIVLGWLLALPGYARADVQPIERSCANGGSCSAKDVSIAAARAKTSPPPCDIGQKVSFDLVVDLKSTATARYDIGVFVSPDNGSANDGDTCLVNDISRIPSPDDGDTCGDIGKQTRTGIDLGNVEVECADSDGDGTVDVDSCVTWDQNKGLDCSGAADVGPGAPSKCRCERINITGVHVACGGQDCSAGGDACNEGFCNLDTDQCDTRPKDAGTACGDGNACNGDEVCDASGTCQPGTPLTCDDGNACNGVETCDPASGCHAGTPPTCDDGNACNGVETCDPASGCHAGTAPTCDDGNACNGVETCVPATGCQPGTAPTCNDNNACNGVETCDPASGCVAGTPLNCNDGNACNGVETCDPASGCHTGTPVVCTPSDDCHLAGTCDPATGECGQGDPVPLETEQSARAYGLTLRLGGNDVPLGAPDTGDVTDGSVSKNLAIIDQLEPLINIHLMDENATAGSGHSEADSETANVALLNLASPPPIPLPLPPAPLAYLVQASAVESKVVCDASASGAACSDAGSHIANLKILGIQYGDVTPNNRPQPVNVNIPGVGNVTIAIFEEEETSGANAGETQPQDGVNHANLKLNAIHVKIELGGNEVLDLVVAHAEGSATAGPICTESAHVSGRGLVAGATLCTEDGKPCDQFVDDPSNQLVNELKGLVDLPAGGGSQQTSVDVGPIPDAINSPTFTLVKADAGTSQTDGTVSGNDAQSHTLTRTAQADIIDTHDGNPQSTPVIHLGVIQTECNSTTANGGSSTGTTTIADATIGGQDLCTAIGLDPAPCGLGKACCHPPVNTNLCTDTPLAPLLQPICDGLGLKLLLNEQTGNQTGNPTDITVNGVHVIAKTPLGLNADAKVSSSHCDAGSPAAE